jgi:hypothetical protein
MASELAVDRDREPAGRIGRRAASKDREPQKVTTDSISRFFMMRVSPDEHGADCAQVFYGTSKKHADKKNAFRFNELTQWVEMVGTLL